MTKKPAAPGEILDLYKGGYLSEAEAIQALEDVFCPPAQQAHDPLLAALKDAADALASLDIDALGWAADGNSCWPIRDELLKKISDALAPYTTPGAKP